MSGYVLMDVVGVTDYGMSDMVPLGKQPSVLLMSILIAVNIGLSAQIRIVGESGRRR